MLLSLLISRISLIVLKCYLFEIRLKLHRKVLQRENGVRENGVTVKTGSGLAKQHFTARYPHITRLSSASLFTINKVAACACIHWLGATFDT